MPATRVHHLNFVVRDLDAASRRFESLLGLAPFEPVDHPARGARIARSRIGETWLVLVCPYDDNSVPGRFLEENGEGFFLLSVGSGDLEADLARLFADRDSGIPQTRHGILDWRVADVGEAYGAVFQLTDDS